MLVAAGCSDSFTSPIALEGTYDLEYVQGQPLPSGVQQTPTAYVVYTGGVLVLRADATFDAELYGQTTNPQYGTVVNTTDAASGTYSVSGNQIYVHVTSASGEELAGDATGTVSGSTVTIGALTFVRR